MLTAEENVFCKDLGLLEYDNFMSLFETTTKKTIMAESESEAADAIVTFSSSVK